MIFILQREHKSENIVTSNQYFITHFKEIAPGIRVGLA